MKENQKRLQINDFFTSTEYTVLEPHFVELAFNSRNVKSNQWDRKTCFLLENAKNRPLIIARSCKNQK